MWAMASVNSSGWRMVRRLEQAGQAGVGGEGEAVAAEAWHGHGGQSQAAPRTPELSPWWLRSTGVVETSLNTWRAMRAGNCA